VVIPESLTNGSNLLIATGAGSRAAAAAAIQGHLPVATRFYFPNGDTTGGNRTLISLLNPTGGVATVTMTFLYQSAQLRRYSQTVAPHTLATVDLAAVGGANQHMSVIVEADRRIAAQSDLYYASGDGDSALGASGPATSWYLAEGYTGGGFGEYLEIMNPNPAYANVDVRFLPFNTRPLNEQRFVIGPDSMIVINTNLYMPGQSFSTIVTSSQGVVVERTMHFGAGGHGTHDKVGITTASTVWSFAESTTASERQTFLTVLNPNQAAPAAVTATFFDSKGRPVGTRTIIIDPLHRGNIKVNDVLPAAEVGTILTSNVPVVAEQPQYEGPANLGLARSGSDLFGRNGGSTAWAFPGGDAANGSHAYLYLFNPGLKATTLQVTFYGTTGGTMQRTLTLPANSRGLIDVNAVGGLPSSRYGAIVRSTDGGAFIAAQLVLDSLSHRAASSQGQAY